MREEEKFIFSLSFQKLYQKFPSRQYDYSIFDLEKAKNFYNLCYKNHPNFDQFLENFCVEIDFLNLYRGVRYKFVMNQSELCRINHR